MASATTAESAKSIPTFPRPLDDCGGRIDAADTLTDLQRIYVELPDEKTAVSASQKSQTQIAAESLEIVRSSLDGSGSRLIPKRMVM